MALLTETDLFGIVEALVNGGGEVAGLGMTTQRAHSMTNATECYWGTSGRGNAKAAARFRYAATQGVVQVVRRGRTEQVGLTDAGIALYLRHRGADQEAR